MADHEQDSGEKEFDASEQKQKKAREDGNIPQSKEVNNFATVAGIIIAAFVFNALTGHALFELFSKLFYRADAFADDTFNSGGLVTLGLMQNSMLQLAPIFVILASVVALALVATRGVAFSPKKIKPDVKKISPVGNLKKKYGASGLIDFAKDTAKMLFAGVIAFIFLLQFAQDYYASSALREGQISEFTFGQVMRLILAFGLFQFVLAAIDFPIQKRLHANKLKMTREEMKKEAKQSEGDPHLKQSRRQKGAEIASGKMMQNVKDATVIMVNPTHYAVALKWDQDGQKAPVCVAKGVDHLAAKIRELAEEHGVPIYRDPPSTRSIYRMVEIDEEIRQEHFAAVAAAIQFVQSVRAKT